MQTQALSAAVLAISLFAAGSAAAAAPFNAQAKLVTPVSAPTTTTINKVDWTCDGDACAGKARYAPSLDSFMKECRKVRTALGPLAGYTSRGLAMSPTNLAACNEGPR